MGVNGVQSLPETYSHLSSRPSQSDARTNPRSDVHVPNDLASLRQHRGRRGSREESVDAPGGSGGSIRLMLAGSLPTVRKGLKMRLALEEDLDLVGEADADTEAMYLACALRPDVVLMDVDAPTGVIDIALAERLRSAAPRSALVLLGLSDDAAAWERARAAGAASFVAKHRTEELLVATILQLAHAKRRSHARLSSDTVEERGAPAGRVNEPTSSEEERNEEDSGERARPGPAVDPRDAPQALRHRVGHAHERR